MTGHSITFPPLCSQFRKSNRSVVLDRVNSDVPLGLIRSDYIYKSEVVSLSDDVFLPNKQVSIRATHKTTLF